jgi:release factor glutamine methyltransferase
MSERSIKELTEPPYTEGLTPTRAHAAAESYLRSRGVEAPHRTAEILMSWVLETGRVGLFLRTENLGATEAGMLRDALSLRSMGVPLQYVVGEQQFMDVVLEVTPGVFIPRPETERLVEVALESLAGRSYPTAVDVGTGSGAIAIAIKREVPAARVIATDVSRTAVDVARRNAARLELQVDVLFGDLLEPVSGDLRGAVDLIVSNPPYVTREEYETVASEVRAEPSEALVGGIEFHQRLSESAPEWLAPGGWVVVEIGSSQGEAVSRIFGQRLSDVEVLTDLAGRDRVVRGRRREGRSAA